MNEWRMLLLQGAELQPYVDALGALRIQVFHDFPYLYKGDLDYERAYLKLYVDCPESFVVLVLDSRSKVVGATTCLPLIYEDDAVKAGFIQRGEDLTQICYFGESILLKCYRGLGIGKQFFQYREAHARRLGLNTTVFCAVDRNSDHPLCPENYQPLNGFWQSLGYAEQADLQARFSWQDRGDKSETVKTLTFWSKQLEG